MGLLEREIKELRILHKKLNSGEISLKTVNAHIGIYNQTEKRARMLLQATSLTTKQDGIMGRIVKSNLISGKKDIRIDPSEEKVKCPYKDYNPITRNECLDISESWTIPECQGCKNGKITRERLLD